MLANLLPLAAGAAVIYALVRFLDARALGRATTAPPAASSTASSTAPAASGSVVSTEMASASDEFGEPVAPQVVEYGDAVPVQPGYADNLLGAAPLAYTSEVDGAPAGWVQ